MFIFVIRLRFPSKLSIAEVLRKRYGDRILKLVKKFEKTDIKHENALFDLQFLKICEDHNAIQLICFIFCYIFSVYISYKTSFSIKAFYCRSLKEKIW